MNAYFKSFKHIKVNMLTSSVSKKSRTRQLIQCLTPHSGIMSLVGTISSLILSEEEIILLYSILDIQTGICHVWRITYFQALLSLRNRIFKVPTFSFKKIRKIYKNTPSRKLQEKKTLILNITRAFVNHFYFSARCSPKREIQVKKCTDWWRRINNHHCPPLGQGIPHRAIANIALLQNVSNKLLMNIFLRSTDSHSSWPIWALQDCHSRRHRCKSMHSTGSHLSWPISANQDGRDKQQRCKYLHPTDSHFS